MFVHDDFFACMVRKIHCFVQLQVFLRFIFDFATQVSISSRHQEVRVPVLRELGEALDRVVRVKLARVERAIPDSALHRVVAAVPHAIGILAHDARYEGGGAGLDTLVDLGLQLGFGGLEGGLAS